MKRVKLTKAKKSYRPYRGINRILLRYADRAVEKLGNILWPPSYEILEIKIKEDDLP